jgi:hypothetical protein
VDTGWSFWLRLAGVIVLAIIVRQLVLRYGHKMMHDRDKPGSKGPKRPNNSNRSKDR